MLNKVFNGWYNHTLNQRIENNLSLEPHLTTFSEMEKDNHQKLAEDYWEQTLITKAFVWLKQYAYFKKVGCPLSIFIMLF